MVQGTLPIIFDGQERKPEAKGVYLGLVYQRILQGLAPAMKVQVEANFKQSREFIETAIDAINKIRPA